MCKNKGKFCYNNQGGDTGYCDYCIKEGYGNAPVKKRDAEKKLDQKQNKELRAKVGKCEIGSPVCIGLPEGTQHKKGRVGKNLTDLKEKIVSCNPCNTWCEEHPLEAKALGVAKSRLKKDAA